MKFINFYKRVLSALILIPFTLYFSLKGFFLFDIFLIFCFLITFIEWHKMTKDHFFYIPGIFFIMFSFYTVSNIRNSDIYFGLDNFLFVFLICISTDIGGYVFGKFFKGPKLSKISPNKTYSGVIGSFIFTLITTLFLINEYIVPVSTNILTSNNFYILIYSMILSLASQAGDLLISYFKRISGQKDTGNLIPGHGGILDRIDGMILAFPIFFLINLY